MNGTLFRWLCWIVRMPTKHRHHWQMATPAQHEYLHIHSLTRDNNNTPNNGNISKYLRENTTISLIFVLFVCSSVIISHPFCYYFVIFAQAFDDNFDLVAIAIFFAGEWRFHIHLFFVQFHFFCFRHFFWPVSFEWFGCSDRNDFVFYAEIRLSLSSRKLKWSRVNGMNAGFFCQWHQEGGLL